MKVNWVERLKELRRFYGSYNALAKSLFPTQKQPGRYLRLILQGKRGLSKRTLEKVKRRWYYWTSKEKKEEQKETYEDYLTIYGLEYSGERGYITTNKSKFNLYVEDYKYFYIGYGKLEDKVPEFFYPSKPLPKKYIKFRVVGVDWDNGPVFGLSEVKKIASKYGKIERITLTKSSTKEKGRHLRIIFKEPLPFDKHIKLREELKDDIKRIVLDVKRWDKNKDLPNKLFLQKIHLNNKKLKNLKRFVIGSYVVEVKNGMLYFKRVKQ
jgi:hypothetical protein